MLLSGSVSLLFVVFGPVAPVGLSIGVWPSRGINACDSMRASRSVMVSARKDWTAESMLDDDGLDDEPLETARRRVPLSIVLSIVLSLMLFVLTVLVVLVCFDAVNDAIDAMRRKLGDQGSCGLKRLMRCVRLSWCAAFKLFFVYSGVLWELSSLDALVVRMRTARVSASLSMQAFITSHIRL